VILREIALFARGYKLASLWGCPMSDHCQGVCTAGTMGCALVRGSPRNSRGDSGFESYITEKIRQISSSGCHMMEISS
jgi:hypothetical protein